MTASPAAVPRIERGTILWYRMFDVCDAILLPAAERLLLETHIDRGSVQFRKSLRRELGALTSRAAPLLVDAGPLEITVGARTVEGHASMKLFDHGTLSLTFEVNVADASLDEVARLAGEIHDIDALASVARRELETLVQRISQAVTGPHDWGAGQSYAVVLIEQLAGSDDVARVRAWSGLPKLASCELDRRAAAPEQHQDVLGYTDAYLEDDLVVIGTAAALVIEPSGTREVPDLIELALAQMLQLRYYDEVLDRDLQQACLDFSRRPILLAVYSPFGAATRDLSRRLVELTEFTERIDNSLKVVSDLYLARVYRKVVQRFAIPLLKDRVAHKQALAMQIYNVLRDEMQMLRSFTLEVAILLLILIEVVMALWH